MNKNMPYQQQMMHWYAHQPVPPAWQQQMPPMNNQQPYMPPPQAGFIPPPVGVAPMQPPVQAPVAQNNGSILTSSGFIKGALIGAAAAYLLTNDKVQQTVIKTAVKSWAMVQGGVEEMKERFRDAEAELHAGDFEE